VGKKKGGKGGAAAAAGEALIPPLGASAAGAAGAAAPAGYKAVGCKVVWACQGLGGYAYAVAAQHISPDMLQPWPQETPVRVAVGCGDKTIRVLTLGVRQEQQDNSSSSSAHAGDSSDCLSAACNRDVTAAADAAVAEHQAEPSSSSSSSSSSNAAACGQGMPALCSEVQPGVRQFQLLWRNIGDKVLAVAWHTTHPREHSSYCTLEEQELTRRLFTISVDMHCMNRSAATCEDYLSHSGDYLSHSGDYPSHSVCTHTM
jgi:hypothetical protein